MEFRDWPKALVIIALICTILLMCAMSILVFALVTDIEESIKRILIYASAGYCIVYFMFYLFLKETLD